MPAPALQLTFETPVTSVPRARQLAALVRAADDEGRVEDVSGKAVGHAVDQLFRYFRAAPIDTLHLDRAQVVEAFGTLGDDRCVRLLGAIRARVESIPTAMFWHGVADELGLQEATSPVLAPPAPVVVPSPRGRRRGRSARW